VVAPGHIFPLRAAEGGVLERQGHTEGSIELCRLAGLRPAAAICEIINEDGSMARKPDLDHFAAAHGIPIVTIEDLLQHRVMQADWLIESKSANFPNRHARSHRHEWRLSSFRNVMTGIEHALIFTVGFEKSANPLVRIHSECLSGDALGSLRCDCGFQLENSMNQISESNSGGAVIYLKNQEGRGIGLWNKLEAYALQDGGLDTLDANLELGFQADERHYQDAAAILRMKGVGHVRLLTNNPEKIHELGIYGIHVSQRIAIETNPLPENQAYLRTKRDRFHHQLGNL